MEPSLTIEAEKIVRTLAETLTAPQDAECLPCYLDRMLHDVGCDGTLRLAQRYRDARAPRATGLERRLCAGGGYCDCEVLYNVYWARSDAVEPCRGARRGSTKPCELWHRHRRGDPWC